MYLAFSQSHFEHPKLWTSYSIKEGHKVSSCCALGCFTKLFQISKALAFVTEPKFVSLVCPLACCAAKHAQTACKAQYAMLKAYGKRVKKTCQSAIHPEQHSMRAFTQCRVRISQCIAGKHEDHD